MTYNHNSQALQEPVHEYLDIVNIPSAGDQAFFDHLLYTDDEELIRSVVLEECRLGVYDTETMMTLLGRLGPVALPERRTAPIPSVSSSKPFAPLSQTDGGACNG